MKFPVVLRRGVTPEHEARWNEYYVHAADRDRMVEEGIWRRTQKRENASESGWRDASDHRRRIIHYKHRYGLCRQGDRPSLALMGTYIYYSLSLPESELSVELERAREAMVLGGWQRTAQTEHMQVWRLGDLTCSINLFNEHPEDILAQRTLPSNYCTFDAVIGTREAIAVAPRLPWQVLANGMRIKDLRERPSVVSDLSALTQLLPFHVELGCGPSIEAGVPALHHLHEIYRVTEIAAGRFVFGGREDDFLERLFLRPTTEFPKLSRLYQAAFVAEPTPAHEALRALQEAGHLVGPIMTNNFDGLTHRVGLQEQFLRRYDEIIPDVDFHPQAKSLLVVGSHADRRRVQARARGLGLQVVYLDPEGYWFDGHFIDYPLEGPRNGDLLCRKGATEGLVHLCTLLGVQL